MSAQLCDFLFSGLSDKGYFANPLIESLVAKYALSLTCPVIPPKQELEEALRLFGTPEAAAAAHRAFEQGGERAVEQRGVRDALARARNGYVAP
jgi:hypothetical protein